MANFDLTTLAVKMICPNNVVKTDDTDIPSVLVYIPKFKNSDVLTGGNDSTHPAFIVNGVEIPGFYYGKFQAKVYNSVAYSLPAEDPTASINFDTARARCEAMDFYGAAACVAIFLINRYNGEKGGGNGRIFYLFYPLHLLVIRGIKMAVGL